MSRVSPPLFQTVGSPGYHVVCRIHDRETVYDALGLYSDYLNWNTQPEIEGRLRDVLCEIYGHLPYAGPPWTWKPKGVCYWCRADTQQGALPSSISSEPQERDSL